MHHHHHGRSHAPIGRGLLFVAAGTVAALALSRMSRTRRTDPMDAPRKALRDQGAMRVVGRSVTVNRPRQDLYRVWRDFSRFPEFMENVRSVEVVDDSRSRWTVEGPGGADISFTSQIVEDVPGERIAWRSDEDATVPNSGSIAFRDAPAGRGTEVDLTIAYEPPGGTIGAMVAKMFQREPKIQARRDLKRFKQLMETGEIATSRSRPDPQDL